MPYNPGVQYRGDEYLFRAISGLGQDLGTAVKKLRSDREESQFLDQQINGLMEASLPYAKQGLVDPQKAAAELDKLGGMSLPQKRAKAATLAFQLNQLSKQADDMRQSKRDEELAAYRNKTLELQQGEIQRKESTEAANAGFTSGLGGVFGAADPNVRDANLAYLFQNNPGVDPRVVENVFRGLTMMQAGNPKTKLSAAEDLEPFDVGGFKGVRSKTTGQVLQERPAKATTPVRASVRNDPITGKPVVSVSGSLEEMKSAFPDMQFDGAVGADARAKDELAMAQEALSKGVDPAKVRRLYKERTGKDLP